MDRQVYYDVVEALSGAPVSATPHFGLLQRRFPGCAHAPATQQLSSLSSDVRRPSQQQ
jgi:hypothetical protein